jgi:TetR/AcrR family transcriptional repressor of nem operon
MMSVISMDALMPQILSRKEETHDRIVRTAARAIRQRGFSGVGVAEVMKEAGLTHGGFYAHFSSRTALLAEASDRAGAEGVAALRQIALAAPPGRQLAALVDAYLSVEHLKAAEFGCPVAALACEMPRQDGEVRAAASARIQDFLALIQELTPGRSTARLQQAQAVLAGLVGTLVLARAVDDPQLSAAMLEAGRKNLQAQIRA